MGGAAGGERAIDREPERPRLRPFLEPRLGIARWFGVGRHRRLPVAADEAFSSFETAVDIEGADHRFASIREVRRIVAPAGRTLTPAQGEPWAERKRAGHARQRLAANERGVALGEGALSLVRKRLVQHGRHDHTEHAVPQELQALIAAGLCACARMAERESEQRRARKAMTERIFERLRRCSGGLRLGRRNSCGPGR